MTSDKNILSKRNPFNNDVIYEIPKTTVIGLVQQIQAAQKQFLDWKETSIESRIEWLSKIKQQYILLKEKIIYTESLDQGLPIHFTEKSNYEIGIHRIDEMHEELRLSLSHVDEKKMFSPMGLVSVILSWNLSNRLFIERVLPAVMAGNVVLVKASSYSLGMVNLWKDLLAQISFPENVIQFVVSDELDVKNLITTHPGIKAVSVTGHLETCAQVFQKQSILAKQQFKKLQMFSGSKNSAVVLREPTEALVKEVLESFLIGQGQLFWNSSRLFILEKFQQQWIDAIQGFLVQIQNAQNVNEYSYWSPLINLNSRGIYDDILKQAKDDHAKIISSSTSSKEQFVSPFFTYDMSNCSELQQDELGLPTFVLSAVKYGFDIPKYSNVSYYGGPVSIWWDQPSSKVVANLDTGFMSVNKWSVFLADQMSHVKQSAYGIQDNRIFGAFNSNVKILS